MDWVANGNKYNVEYYFGTFIDFFCCSSRSLIYNTGMVDVDSIMARVESSKVSTILATLNETGTKRYRNQ